MGGLTGMTNHHEIAENHIPTAMIRAGRPVYDPRCEELPAFGTWLALS